MNTYVFIILILNVLTSNLKIVFSGIFFIILDSQLNRSQDFTKLLSQQTSQQQEYLNEEIKPSLLDILNTNIEEEEEIHKESLNIDLTETNNIEFNEETLTKPQQLIREGLNRIKLDKSLLYKAYIQKSNVYRSQSNTKSNIVQKIEKIFSRFINNLKFNLPIKLKIPNRSNWLNSTFSNDR